MNWKKFKRFFTTFETPKEYKNKEKELTKEDFKIWGYIGDLQRNINQIWEYILKNKTDFSEPIIKTSTDKFYRKRRLKEHQIWTELQDSVLKKLVQEQKKIPDIAKALERTPFSIICRGTRILKAGTLEIFKELIREYEDNLDKDVYYVDGLEVKKWDS